VWDTATGQLLHTLAGHQHAVYTVAYNNPFGDLIASGSFDGAACIWDARTGLLRWCLRGHAAEVVCLAFNPQVRTCVHKRRRGEEEEEEEEEED
jgi:dynein assembly factor with WDR repeat domains 1